MTDLVLVVLFIALPVLTWWISRNATVTAVSIALGFGLAGNLVQTTIAWGFDWNVRGLQFLVVAVLVILMVLFATLNRVGFPGGEYSRLNQFAIVGIPALAIGGFLVLMRLMAPDAPGSLTAVGYLVNHPLAEDNAKWLNLTSQLAQGSDISFNGYAGGPLLLVMGVVAALISLLCTVLLGGVNEVAGATHPLLGTQFLLIALVPFAFAPFAHHGFLGSGMASRRISVGAIWTGMFVVFLASAVVTSYGHLSLQFVLLVLILCGSVFLMEFPFLVKLSSALVVVTTASVWLPLNVLAFGIVAAGFIVVISRRSLTGFFVLLFTAVVSWDAVFSSALYVLGIGSGSGSAAEVTGDSGTTGVEVPSGEIAASAHLFQAPGGTEVVEPLLGILAVISVLAVVWLFVRYRPGFDWRSSAPLLPLTVFGLYTLAITVGDAVITGGAPHYGGQKIMFAFIVMAIAVTLPVALTVFENQVLRGLAIGSVVVLLSIDSILPRALSALSPVLWPSVNTAEPQYWSGAEVNGTGDQPISISPIACFTVPPQSQVPTALPFGQESYACTRLLLGLNALEGKAGYVPEWLQTDWLSNRSNWNEYFDALDASSDLLGNRAVIQMGPERQLVGLQPWSMVLGRNTPLP